MIKELIDTDKSVFIAAILSQSQNTPHQVLDRLICPSHSFAISTWVLSL
jgi:hypothetical protein